MPGVTELLKVVKVLEVLKVLKVFQRSNSIGSTGPGAAGCRIGGRADPFHSSPEGEILERVVASPEVG